MSRKMEKLVEQNEENQILQRSPHHLRDELSQNEGSTEPNQVEKKKMERIGTVAYCAQVWRLARTKKLRMTKNGI